MQCGLLPLHLLCFQYLFWLYIFRNTIVYRLIIIPPFISLNLGFRCLNSDLANSISFGNQILFVHPKKQPEKFTTLRPESLTHRRTLKPLLSTQADKNGTEKDLKPIEVLNIRIQLSKSQKKCERASSNHDALELFKSFLEYLALIVDICSKYVSKNSLEHERDRPNVLFSETNFTRDNWQMNLFEFLANHTFNEAKSGKLSEHIATSDLFEHFSAKSTILAGWKRASKGSLERNVQDTISIHLQTCSSLLACLIKSFYTSDSELPMDELLSKAVTVGIIPSSLIYGMPILYLKKYGLEASLNCIDHILLHKQPANKIYQPVIGYLEEKKDVDALIKIYKHMTEISKTNISGFLLVRLLLTIKQYTMDKLSNESTENIAAIYSKMREHLEFALQNYESNRCTPFLSYDLACILSDEFNKIIPGLFHISTVFSESRGSHELRTTNGICNICKYKIPLVKLTNEERLFIFDKWLGSIYSSNKLEIFGLADFYKVLYEAIKTNNPYTCVLDGQNIGFHSIGKTVKFNPAMVEAARLEMISRGENPLIVLPAFRGIYESRDDIQLSILSFFFEDTENFTSLEGIPKYSKNYLNFNLNWSKIFKQWHIADYVYTCNPIGYDDNYLFMASIMTGSDKEFALFAKYLKDTLNIYFDVDSDMNLRQRSVDFSDSLGYSDRYPYLTIVTNDTLSNLSISGTPENLLNRWRSLSLRPYKVFDRLGKSFNEDPSNYHVIVSNRPHYSLEINAIHNSNNWHIPLGLRTAHSEDDGGCECTTVKGDNSLIYVTMVKPLGTERSEKDKMHKAWLKEHGYISRSIPYTGSAVSDNKWKFKIYTQEPEVTYQKFTPLQQTSWLCAKLGLLDERISSSEVHQSPLFNL